MVHCKIHNVGFYTPEPRAIYCMSLQRETNKLAISRSDASIEIWNLNDCPFIERTIPANLENFSIEGLCWFGDRLFSVGIHGLLVEYNLQELAIKNKWMVTGESAMCLDICFCKSLVAVGTEQGYINLFSINEDGVNFEKFMDKQEGRIVCINFSKDGEFLATGSLNAIRIWNINTGHAIHRMQLGRIESKKDTVVWCIHFLSDFTIFSGDSRGILTLWDAKLGAQIENYQSHKADITALCLSEEEDSVYCAGVDPLITNYQKVKVGQSYKWVKSIQRKIHEHDVRALVFHKNKLYSAGMDSYLACSYNPPKTLIKYAPVMQVPCVQLASKARLILLRYSNYVEIWSLADTETTKENYKGLVQLTSKPKKLVAIQRLKLNWSGEDEGEGIFCSSISSDGQWILVSTYSGFRLYELEIKKEKPKLTKVDELDDCDKPCVQACFNDKSKQLIVVLRTGTIVVYDLGDGTPFISQTIINTNVFEDTVSLLTVSTCGKYLVVGDTKSNIAIWTQTKDGYTLWNKIPRYPAPPTTLAVNSATACLVVAYSDSKIIEYDIKNREFTSRSRNFNQNLPSNWKTRSNPIRNITFDPRKTNVILLSDDSNLTVISSEKESETEASPSKSKRSTMNGVGSAKVDFKTVQKYKHLVYFNHLNNDELVAVEVNPLTILKKLPPAFAQKTFGTK
ncbi:hypothetical protein GWI33_016325 [Rhynchophorus ferrugineus]|uniref:WD repeat-containing protein 55 homolog n=1 Tax=Rhynchophorus ferrugineus TaxID=354439 RepID=A0A834I1U3_RHYFE|nr:hypothetical protein GWI33_016325 [Rhynchophorus ferrugineus]